MNNTQLYDTVIKKLKNRDWDGLEESMNKLEQNLQFEGPPDIDVCGDPQENQILTTALISYGRQQLKQHLQPAQSGPTFSEYD